MDALDHMTQAEIWKLAGELLTPKEIRECLTKALNALGAADNERVKVANSALLLSDPDLEMAEVVMGVAGLGTFLAQQPLHQRLHV